MDKPVGPAVVQLIAAAGFYGGEKVVANICRLLPRQAMVVLCLTRNNSPVLPFQEALLRIPSVECRALRSIFAVFLQLGRLHREYSRLIIHAHGYKETCIACVFRLFSSCRIIVTQHGFTSRSRKLRFYNFINKLCCRFGPVEQVICVSRAILDTYVRFGVKKTRLCYLPNGIEPAAGDCLKQRKAAKNKLLASLNLTETTLLVLFAGRLSAEKDPLLFLRVVAALREKYPGIKALIAGTGPLRQEMELFVKQYHLGGNIKFLGYVNDMNALLAAVDLLVLTSVTEGLPLIVLESLVAGTPVVAAAVGDLPEVIVPDANGMLVSSRLPEDFVNSCEKILEKKLIVASGDNVEGMGFLDHRYNLHAQREAYQRLYSS